MMRPALGQRGATTSKCKKGWKTPWTSLTMIAESNAPNEAQINNQNHHIQREHGDIDYDDYDCDDNESKDEDDC